jgi:nitrite reductase (NO-forming)
MLKLTNSNRLRFSVFGIALLALIAFTTGCSSNLKQAQASVSHTNAQQNNFKNNGSSASMKSLNQKPRPMTVERNGHNVTINMYTEETFVTISPGVQFPALTFDGTVPGPVLYLQQGDHVTITLHNLDPNMSHSIDFHAAMVAPNEAFTDVAPGKSKTIVFDATIPGVFMYHCDSEPMALHIAQGMYGAVVVTPEGQQPPNYTIVQSEFYKSMDLNSVMNDLPTYVVFNGEANQYIDKPLTAKVGQSITVAFINAGPNNFSAFHVVGTILQDVQASGNPKNNLYNVQTYTVAPGDGALIHLIFNHSGIYSFASHSMNSMSKGATGNINVTN